MIVRVFKTLLLLTVLFLLLVALVAWAFGLKPLCGPKSIADTQIGLHLPPINTVEQELIGLGWKVKPEGLDLWHFNYPGYELQTWAIKTYDLPLYKPEVLIEIHKNMSMEPLTDTLSEEEGKYYDKTNVDGGIAIVIDDARSIPMPVFLHDFVYKDVVKNLEKVGFSQIKVNPDRYTQVCD